MKSNRIYAMELVRSFQVGQLGRRDFLKRMTAVLGSAAAANMVLAACQPLQPGQTVPPVTKSESGGEGEGSGAAAMSAAGLMTGMVDYPDVDNGTLMGYLARPEGDEPAPAVVVIQEWWGLNDHIMDVANRLAHEGYVTLAPDLYHGQVATEPDEARKLVMELDMPAAVREIGQAIAYLLDQEYVSGDKVGIIGFCMGGGLVLQTALVNESLAVAIPFYGSPLSAEDAGKVTAPVLGLYGGADQGIPADAVKKMEEGLQAAGIPNQIIIYDGAPHAFFNDTRDSYTPAAAEDAWPRVLQWLNTYLRS
ncbi:MAG: dienelactone hydrolase family protein [Caldilineaceae bacterium]|nr:dienelactone hydrolase family protein [Caldilineaceae bacterium]MCB0096604.1 dienelactone hydrolase family protein [Caldilineaceae bacterium]MCB0138756.1 dienelactone hydrolase family protein [Caldilineaceae bacterium]